MHPNSLANLSKGKKFGTGQPTNLGGAPKGKRFSTCLQEMLDKEMMFEDLDGVTKEMSTAEAVVLTLVKKALIDKDSKSLKMIIDIRMKDDDDLPVYEKQKLSLAAQEVLKKAGVALPIH